MADLNEDLDERLDTNIVQCYICHRFKCFKNSVLVKHVFEVHSYEPSFMFACRIECCPRSFTSGSTYGSFVTHANRKHHNWREKLDAMPCLTSSGFLGALEGDDFLPVRASDGCDQSTVNRDADQDEDQDSFRDSSSSSSISSDQIGAEGFSDTFRVDEEFDSPDHNEDCENVRSSSIAAGLFLLTLKERYRLPQSVVKFCVGSVSQLIQLACQEMKPNDPLQMSEDETLAVYNMNPFELLQTEYQQTKFYRTHFRLVEPITIELGTRTEWKKVGCKRQLVEVRDTFQYVPLFENLESILQNEAIYTEVFQSHTRSDHLIGDFCDATLLKNHPVFKNDDQALQLVCYYDDVEGCNPLGSHRGDNKLALFYFTLGNIRPKYRSKLHSIFLIACVVYPHLQKYGFEKVLQPFITDVNKLTQGVKLKIGKNLRVVKGAVVAWLCDTLAAHSIGGFKVGVGFALRKCRNCLATSETMSTKFLEKHFILRSIANYEYHCSLLNGPLREQDSVTYGINSSSVLNNLHHFHVADGQLPQDVMHLLLEGALPYEVKLLLNCFIIQKKYFTLDYLNSQLRSFGFSPEEARDKPPIVKSNQITSEGHLSMKAVEMWIFSMYLPLLVGPKVPEDDPFWECYLLLIDIVKVATARIQSPGLAMYLQVLVNDHHQAFIRLYPGASVIPKLHYCVHLPSQIIKIGPLMSSCCLRMEAKHSYFKDVARTSGFKNVAYTVARRHQRLQCAYLQNKDFFIDYETGPCKDPFPLQDASALLISLITDTFTPISSDEFIYRLAWVRYEGNTYRPVAFVLYDWQTDDLPKFGQIKDVYTIQSICFLVITMYKTVGISRHYNTYVVESDKTTRIILLKHLYGHQPVLGHTLDHQIHICLLSHVIRA